MVNGCPFFEPVLGIHARLVRGYRLATEREIRLPSIEECHSGCLTERFEICPLYEGACLVFPVEARPRAPPRRSTSRGPLETGLGTRGV